jgi:hypothetical protein
MELHDYHCNYADDQDHLTTISAKRMKIDHVSIAGGRGKDGATRVRGW